MSTALDILVTVLLFAFAGYLAVVSLPWPIRRRQVRLHMWQNGPSLEGVLVGKTSAFYKLQDVRVLVSESDSVATEGTAWVPRASVMWVQNT